MLTLSLTKLTALIFGVFTFAAIIWAAHKLANPIWFKCRRCSAMFDECGRVGFASDLKPGQEPEWTDCPDCARVITTIPAKPTINRVHSFPDQEHSEFPTGLSSPVSGGGRETNLSSRSGDRQVSALSPESRVCNPTTTIT